jgi:hypothetical protein
VSDKEITHEPTLKKGVFYEGDLVNGIPNGKGKLTTTVCFVAVKMKDNLKFLKRSICYEVER